MKCTLELERILKESINKYPELDEDVATFFAYGLECVSNSDFENKYSIFDYMFISDRILSSKIPLNNHQIS